MRTKKTVMTAMLASLICVATMVIKIPFPLGYLNLGDGFVLLAGWMLSMPYCVLAAGIGSLLADILLGYVSYAPATFIIKSLMAAIAYGLFRKLNKKHGLIKASIISGLVSEVVMIAGYYIYEGIFLYGFITSTANIVINAVQGFAGIVVGTVLIKIFKKYKIMDNI